MLGTCGRTLQQLQLGLESGEEKGLLGAWTQGSMGHPTGSLSEVGRGARPSQRGKATRQGALLT